MHLGISIHALLAESDGGFHKIICQLMVFLSTLSLRRATCGGRPQSGWINISIHALLAESDSQCRTLARGIYDFYPRSPCGERRRSFPARRYPANFYPRSPCGERRCGGRPQSDWINISIHALLAESDLPVSVFIDCAAYFYPRSPCGERPSFCILWC